MNFGMIILNQNISKMQNYATWWHSFIIKTEDVYKDIADDVGKKIWYIKLWNW